MPAGTHTVAISNDTGILANDRITNDSVVKVSLTLGDNLVLASDEMLQVSANGTDWVVATGSNKVWVTADDAVTLVTGIGNLTARVIDTAGNVTALPLSNNGYTLDTSAPSIPTGTHTVAISNDTGIDGDRITSDAQVKVTLSLANNLILATGETLQVSANGTDWVVATGSNKVWTTADDAVTLITGTNKTLTARVVDTAGNVTALTLSGNNYTLKNAPSELVGTHTVAISNDTGIDGDRITSDAQVKVALSLANNLILATGETLQVSANGTDWVTATGSNKAWTTADDAVTLIVGTNKTLTARMIDTAGNVTALTLSGNGYTLDTSAPSVLAGTHTVVISNDTGIDGDRITSDAQVKVTLSLANDLILATGETLQVSANGTDWVVTTGNNKAWTTADDAVTLIAGTNKTLTARVVDTAGNVTALTLSGNGYTLDTSAPSVLAGTHTVVISNDTGIDGDRITSDAQVKVTLSLANNLILATGETLQVSANGTDWVVTTGNNKAWVTADDAVTLIAGTNKTLTARVVDTAGNVTALTLSGNGYTLDTSAPSVLAGTHTVVISDDTGIDGDRITSDDQVKVTLSLANNLILATGETLQVSANGTDWVVTTGNNKAWVTADDAVTLIAGTNKTLTARVVDTAGNVTALPLSDNSYTLDTSAPSVLAGTHTVTISDDTGIDGDRITSDAQVKVTLSLANDLILATGEILQVSANGTDWVVTTGSNKAWTTADDAVTLIAGTNKTLTARVIDTAGNVTALPLSDNSYTLDTSAPSVLAGTHTVVISNDTGIDGDRITSDAQVKVTLSLANDLILATDETLQVSANGTDWVVATGSNKAWTTADDAVTLIAGTNKTLTARVVDTAGNVTALTLSGNGYTLDTSAPSVLAGTHTVVISDDTGINGDRITNDAQVKVTLSLGNDLILATGETLQVSANGTDWVVTTGSNKAWETQDNAVTLIAGTGNTLTARVTDIAGNVTALTLSDNGYTLDTSAPSVLAGTHTVTISNDTDIDGDRITSDAQVKVTLSLGNNLTLATGETLQVSANGTDWVVATDSNKAWATADDAVTLVAGTGKTLTARVIDIAGNITVLTLSGNDYILDIVKPTVTAVVVTANSNILKIGDTVTVTLTTDEVVNVHHGVGVDAHTPQYEIMIGGVARQAIYKSGSGSNSLVFEYTVIPGETDTTGGITAGTNKLTANGKSTLEDIAGNDLDLNAVVAASVNTLTVNAIAPVLNTITVGDTALTTGETTTVTFVFSEAPIGFTLEDINAGSGTLSNLQVDGSDTKIYTATLTPGVKIKDATNVITVNTNWTNTIGNAPTGITESSNYEVNTVTPVAMMGQITVLSSGSVKVRGNKDGVAYLVASTLASSVPTQVKLDSYVASPAGIAVKTDILADTFTDLSTLSLGTDRGGKYYLYTVDTIGNVSVRSMNNITVIAGNTLLGDADANNLIGGTGADTITGDAGADTITGGANADILTGGADADIFKYNAIADSTQTNADTITDFNVTADKLDLIDIITTATNGAITDVASLAKYIHAEIDTSVATNVKLYIKTDGVSTGIVNSSNANMLINFTVADAAAQSALVAALNDNTFGEYILVDNTSPIATMEETAALISADIEIKSNETGTAYLFKDTLDLTSQSLDIFDNYVSDITANTAIKTEISANTLTNLSTSGLEAGQYHLYIIDTTGNISTESTNALTLNGGNALSSATISNLVGGTGADTITGGAGANTLRGGTGADTLTGNAGADIFYYGKENIIGDLKADADANTDTITDFDVTTDKLNLIDVILYASGDITDSASLANYIHAEADASVTTNVMLYIKTQGDSGGNVNGTNSNVLINFTVADAAAQSALVNALSDSTLSEYILS
jgi:ribosomal protein L24